MDVMTRLDRWIAAQSAQWRYEWDWLMEGKPVKISLETGKVGQRLFNYWRVSIMLHGTTCPLRQKSIHKVEGSYLEDDWINCWSDEVVFNGKSGLNNLDRILTIFLDWAEAHQPPGA